MHWFGFNRFGLMGGGFMMLLFPLIIGLFFYLFFKSSNRHCTPHNNNALEILDKKFVSGEITEEEYLHKKSILNKGK
ncbi:putative membrane protein [Paramaledivibacter caminithermalis DSM 15212]|uniref:Putative membrane protein n=2 Tax=Paramaledivibacter TaxID=1884934 RepID=A0A1M6R281_PARC5|nr:putative membrane protein [Paramaledivibacter caminithermalis DSM 15212]